MSADHEQCCPPFEPVKWDGKEFTWENKMFIKDRVTSVFHIPINYGRIMTRNMEKIESFGAQVDNLVLTDENSLWGADVYIEVSKEIKDAEMSLISGTFLSKVYEGPFKNISRWVEDMKYFVSSNGKTAKKLYFYYTTCPKCAKKYDKNYVVLIAEV